MLLLTSVLLLFHINFVTAAMIKLPTKPLDQDVAFEKTSKRIDEERVITPEDDWLALKLGRNIPLSHLKKNDAIPDDFLTLKLGMADTPHTLEVGEINLNKDVAMINTNTRNKGIELESANHPQLQANFFNDRNGVQALEDLKERSKIMKFREKVVSVYGKSGNIETIEVKILEKYFRRLPLAKTLEEFCRLKLESVYLIVLKWQEAQLIDWIQKRESVMNILEFDPYATVIATDWKTETLVKSVIVNNRFSETRKTLVSAFTEFYGQDHVLKMFAATQSKPGPSPAKSWARHMQNELLEQWKNNGLQPKEILSKLDMSEAIKFLTTSDLDLATAEYPVIETSSHTKRLWIDMLTEQYGLSKVIVELNRLKSFENNVAASLLDQAMMKWIKDNWSVGEVSEKIDFTSDHTKKEPKSIKMKFLNDYDTLLKSSRPTKKIRLNEDIESR